MACMWGRFIVGTAHFSTESNLIWSNSIAIKSISPTLGWRKDNMRRFKSLDWKINTSLKKLLNLLISFSFFIFVTSPIWLSFIRKGQAPWFNYASPVPLHQLNLILEFRKIKNFPSAKWTNWKYELKNNWWSNSNWWHRCKKMRFPWAREAFMGK